MAVLGNSVFQGICDNMNLPIPKAEYRFCPGRKWRFDWAFVENKLAVEIEGGAWISGRHNRSSGFMKDMEKYNMAAMLGWRILRYTPQQFAKGEMMTDIAEALTYGTVDA